MYLHSSNASERLAAATAPAALPKRSASCPNPKQIKAVHDNFAQCHFSRCHNSSFATSCNARPTLCPQKRWEVYSHIQPFQHWICIESASLTFTKRMPRSTTRPCRMTFALRRTATSDHFSRYILPCWGCIPQTNMHWEIQDCSLSQALTDTICACFEKWLSVKCGCGTSSLSACHNTICTQVENEGSNVALCMVLNYASLWKSLSN